MQLPSQPSHSCIHRVLDNNSCKCRPDPYCLGSTPECLISVSSPTVRIYHSVSLPVIRFSLLCPFLYLVVSPLLLLLSRFDSSHHICNPSDPLPCLPALFPCGIKHSVSSTDSWTCGHERETARGRKREKIKECRKGG